MFEAERQAVQDQITVFCKLNNLPDPSGLTWTPIPFAGKWGISTSFFQLAAQEARLMRESSGTSPAAPIPERAQAIAEAAARFLGTPAGFSQVEAVKGYLNLYYAPGEYAQRAVDTVIEQAERFGSGERRGERVMIEFSQPNTHKAFHVGHLRSAILGDALCRIYDFAGYDVVRANYPGDMGLHVIKWLWNYRKHHIEERPTKDITQWMGNVYADASRRLEEDPTLESEVRAFYALWDQRDPEVVSLWQETRQWSLDGFNEMYDILDIRFDRYYFNSEEEQPGKKVVEELIRHGIAIDERPTGPVIVKLDELLGLKQEKYRVLVVLRSDNTALYATEDLALAIRKFTDYPDLVKSIYVVDVRQSLHFTQIFKTLEIAGYPWAERCIHIPYEVVSLPGNVVMSSREGTIVLLEDLIREAIARALDVVRGKNPTLTDEQMQSVARAVGLGALKFPMLSRDNAKIVTFDWQSALDFNGQAAPYIQYAQVRAGSILRKLEEPLPGPVTPTYALDPAEIQLIDLISRLPDEVQRAAAEYKPLHLANIAYDTAKAFSDFYNQCPVLKAEPEKREARLRLVAAAQQALANTLNLLGIETPEVM